MNATPAVPALVATSQNVQLHNAIQIQISSGSEISVSSSTERQQRVDLPRAKRELAEARALVAEAAAEVAEARVDKAQAELDFAIVWSEGDLLAHDVQRVTTQQTSSTYSTPTARHQVVLPLHLQ